MYLHSYGVMQAWVQDCQGQTVYDSHMPASMDMLVRE